MRLTISKFREKVASSTGPILIILFLAFLALSWIILFRDGRALYAFVLFYGHKELIDSLTSTLSGVGLNLLPTLFFAAASIFSFYFYLSSLRKKISLRKTIFYSLIFQLITFLAYPILARDIFYYMFSDRVMRLYSINVWQTPINNLGFDKFAWTDWQLQTKVYGGVNQFFYNFASLLGGNDLIQSLLAYKGLALFFSFASMYIVYKIAKKYFPKKEALMLRLIFWNPLFVLEIAGSGHNDILMIFFLLLTLYYYLENKWGFMGISLGLAVGVKVIAIILFPLLLIDSLIRKQFKDGLLFAFSFTVLNLLTFLYMLTSPLFFIKRVIENSLVLWQGLPSLVNKLVPVKNTLFTLGAVITGASVFFYQLKKRVNPFLAYLLIMSLYLMLFAGAYWNWYVLWMFIFIPFLKENALTKAIFALTFTSLTAYPLYWISLRFDYQNILWQFVFYIWLFGVPTAIFFYSRRNSKFLKIGAA